MILKIDLDPDSIKCLTKVAVKERRPITLQAEVLILRNLGLWPISDDPRPEGAHQPTPEGAA